MEIYSIIFVTVLMFQYTLQNPDDMSTKYISFNLYKGVNSYDKIFYDSGVTAFKTYSQFNPNKKTVFYFPGWSENPNNKSQESIQVISEAFIRKGNINLVVLDYSELVKGHSMFDYLSAFRNSSSIGRLLGKFFIKFIPDIQPIHSVHLISHSMGSQIMSYAARTFAPGIFRLTALDPAGPLYSLMGVPHLTASDGSFVDVIHTDAGNYGDSRSVGTVDFFPNKGRRIQPYCVNKENAFCSHHMSWQYYAASVNNPTIFPAKRCTKRSMCLLINTFGYCDCQSYSSDIAYMGYEVAYDVSGDFYLTTSKQAPFGLGMSGLN